MIVLPADGVLPELPEMDSAAVEVPRKEDAALLASIIIYTEGSRQLDTSARLDGYETFFPAPLVAQQTSRKK